MEESITYQTFKQMLDPKFEWGGLKDFDTLVSLGQEATYLKEVPQRILGKLSQALTTNYGEETLTKFAKEIGVSQNSLFIYRWVENRLGGLDIPFDLSWTTLRYIAGTDDPEKWIKKALDEGLSANEIRRLIKIEKGEPVESQPKKITCKSCGYKTEDLMCPGCSKPL